MSASRRMCGLVVAACCVTVAARAQEPAREAGGAQAQSSTLLTLRDAHERALRQHPLLRAAELTSQAADQSVRQTKAAYFPSVFGSVTGAASQEGSRVASGGLNNPIILDRVATGFSINQLITDFGRTSALVGSADRRADAQRATRDARRVDVLLQVDRAYFTALRSQAIENVAEATVGARQLLLDQVMALAASGLRSGLDLSFAKVNLSEAQLLLAQARNDVQAAFTLLSTAVGEPASASTSTAWRLVDPALPARNAGEIDQLIAQALRERPDLAAERFTQQAAERFAAAESALWRPTVAAVGAAGVVPYRETGLTEQYAALGVTVTMPVTTGGAFAARRTESVLRARAEAERVRDLEHRVAQDVRTAWLDREAAFQRLNLAGQLRQHAADAAELAQARYDIGLGSIIELSQAQLALTRAEIERTTAQYDVQLRDALLRYRRGIVP